MAGKIYFPGLNGIRAIAAMIVLVFHIDQCLYLYGLKTLGFHATGMAAHGVTLFFVLSGYLITYLLLIEKQEFGTVNLPKFYVRRILRIWPIYYVVLALGLVIYVWNPELQPFPEGKATQMLLLYSFLLSNVGYGLGLSVTTITPLWSVGVEEQFYAFWPFLLNRSRNLFRGLVAVIVAYLAGKLFLRLVENDRLYAIVFHSSFDCMAVGGLGACLVYTKSRYLGWIYHPAAQVFGWVFLLSSIFYRPVHILTFIDTEVQALVYILIIINVSTNPKTIIDLENRVLDFLGRISYGIYVYHMTVIIITAYLLRTVLKWELQATWYHYSFVFFMVLSLTVLSAYISYTWFERYFLQWKSRAALIQSSMSGDSFPGNRACH